MRLDHLLSKEILPIIPIGDSLVDHWLFGSVFDSAAVASRPCPSRVRPGRPRFRAPRQRRASLFRFEGAAPLARAALLLRSRSRRSRRWVAGRSRPCPARNRRVALLENSIASTSIFVLQATKSQRWMPWRLKPIKDVGGCEKPRGVAYQTSIRGCPNGETRHPSWGVTSA